MNSEILENKTNFIILRENNLVKLYSFKSLVSVYDTETKDLKEIPYTFVNVYGNICSQSKTTARHLNKFKKFIDSNF